MNVTEIFSEIATANRLDVDELQTYLARAGWDFTPFVGNEIEVKFIRQAISHHAKQITARRDKIEAVLAEAIALRDRRLTKAARANPECQCGKCDGSGRINAFSHIANGACFQCDGTGVIKVRKHV